MKNLLCSLIILLIATISYSQGLRPNTLKDGDGHPNDSLFYYTPACSECKIFSLAFSTTTSLPTNIIDSLSLDSQSATGTVTMISSTWSEDSTSVSSQCLLYDYSATFKICFDTDASLCLEGDTTRSEVVEFSLEIDGQCYADYLNSETNVDYFWHKCLGAPDTCDPLEITFDNICCLEEDPNPDPDEDYSHGRNNNSTSELLPIISPNPCLSNLNIQNLTGGEEIIMLSIMGKKLKSIIVDENEKEIMIDDLGNIPSGINFIRVVKNGKIIRLIKFVKL